MEHHVGVRGARKRKRTIQAYTSDNVPRHFLTAARLECAIFECIITEITEITGMTSYVVPKDSDHAGYEVELKDKGYIGRKQNECQSIRRIMIY